MEEEIFQNIWANGFPVAIKTFSEESYLVKHFGLYIKFYIFGFLFWTAANQFKTRSHTTQTLGLSFKYAPGTIYGHEDIFRKKIKTEWE